MRNNYLDKKFEFPKILRLPESAMKMKVGEKVKKI